MKKVIIVYLITLSLFVLTPLRTNALTLPALLPDCDKTVYEVSTGGTIDCGLANKCVTADQLYDENTGQVKSQYGQVLGTTITSKCGFNDFVQLFINGFSYGLAALASVTLFFFIWGGFGFILAAGSPERVQKAKATIVGAVIGMLIVIGAWLIVNFVVTASGTSSGGWLIFNKPWWGGVDCHQTYKDQCARNALKLGCGGEKGSPTDKYVQDLQRTLNNRVDCECGEVTGCFDQKTQNCVANFQLMNNLVSGENFLPSGIVDDATWQAIDAGGMCMAGSANLLSGLSGEAGTAKFCCIPNKPACQNCACFQTADKTCNGQILPPLSLYRMEEKDCGSVSDCGRGCCVPDSAALKVECRDTTQDKCDTGMGYTFLPGQKCTNVSSCGFLLCDCKNSVNNCDYQRMQCPALGSLNPCTGGYNTSYAGDTTLTATTKLKGTDNCNYGTCYVATLDQLAYSCGWMPWSRCNSIISSVKDLEAGFVEKANIVSMNMGGVQVNVIYGTSKICRDQNLK